MHGFPIDCCDDSADLLAHYFFSEFGRCSYRVDGEIYDDTASMTRGHAWIEINGMIVDITGDQFKFDEIFLNYDKKVFVGSGDEFHSLFMIMRREISLGIESLGEMSHDRMYWLYNTILRYLDSFK